MKLEEAKISCTKSKYEEAFIEIATHLPHDIYLMTLATIRAHVAEQDTRIAALESACAVQNDEVCQILGKALGYPGFKNNQKNFAGTTGAQGVCVGAHTAESLAEEAVAALATARAQIPRAFFAGRQRPKLFTFTQLEIEWAYATFADWEATQK